MNLAPELATLLIAAVQLAVIVFVSHLPDRVAMRGLSGIAISNMIIIMIAGAKTKSLFGFETNIGDMMFAAVMLCQAVVYHRWGRETAIENVFLTFLVVVVVFILGQLVQAMPQLEGNDAAYEIDRLFSRSVPVSFASFVAFAIVQYSFVLAMDVLNRYPIWVWYCTTAIACQFVGSLLFYSIAFPPATSHASVMELMITGFISKSIFLLIAAPVLMVPRNKVTLRKSQSARVYAHPSRRTSR